MSKCVNTNGTAQADNCMLGVSVDLAAYHPLCISDVQGSSCNRITLRSSRLGCSTPPIWLPFRLCYSHSGTVQAVGYMLGYSVDLMNCLPQTLQFWRAGQLMLQSHTEELKAWVQHPAYLACIPSLLFSQRHCAS
jgi:hypothetical protein